MVWDKKMRRVSTFAAVAGLMTGAAFVVPAKAADLGGDCCADLEERVAELEATTARKGNRVMSVTVTGRVDEALLMFDTGFDKDTYVVDRGTRLRVEGAGKVRPDVKLGFRIEIKTRPGDAGSVKTKDTFDFANFSVGDVYWYADSATLGRLTVGNTSGSMDNVNIVNLAGSIFDGDPKNPAGSLEWSENIAGVAVETGTAVKKVLGQVAGAGGNMVRWDSPTVANAIGFSASWGQDDVWGVSAIYGQEFNGVKVAATAAYEVEDNQANSGANNELKKTLISGSILHVPSGVYLSAHWGSQEQAGANAGEHVYVHGGVAKDFFGVGQTDIYAEYADSKNFGSINGSAAEGKMWGIGLEQTISAASSIAYLNYRNHSATNLAADDINDVTTFIGGVRVKF